MQDLNTNVVSVVSLLGEVQDLANSLKSDLGNTDLDYDRQFKKLEKKVDTAFMLLDELAPKYKPTDSQTTDAGQK